MANFFSRTWNRWTGKDKRGPTFDADAAAARSRASATKDANINVRRLAGTLTGAGGDRLTTKFRTGPDGELIPDRTITLSDVNQQLHDTSGRTAQAATDTLLDKLRGGGMQEAIEGRLVGLGRRRLDPLQAQQRASLAERLAGTGVSPDSALSDRAQFNLARGQNDAMTSLLLGGYKTAADIEGQERAFLQSEANRGLSARSLLTNPNLPAGLNVQQGGVNREGLDQTAFGSQVADFNRRQSQPGLFDALIGAGKLAGTAIADAHTGGMFSAAKGATQSVSPHAEAANMPWWKKFAGNFGAS